MKIRDSQNHHRSSLTLFVLCIGLAAAGWVSSSAFSQDKPVNPGRVIDFLNQTISWFHQSVEQQQQLASDSRDSVFVAGNRQIAEQAVRLIFQFARTEAQSAPESVNSGPQNSQQKASPYESLMQLEMKARQQEQQVRGEVQNLRTKLAAASGKRRKDLEAQLAETQSEVNLAQARLDAIRNMAQFVGGSPTGATGLEAQIDALASTLPGELSDGAQTKNVSVNSNSGSTAPAQSATGGPVTGLWQAGVNLFTMWGKFRTVDGVIQQTRALAATVQQIRNPLVSQLRDLTQSGDQLAQQADTANAVQLVNTKQQLDALTQQFKQLTAAAIPIAKCGILLDLFQKNLADWRGSLIDRLLSDLRSLLARILVLVVVLAAVWGASKLWRRAIYRYVHDGRRRSQLLWVRRFVIWFVVGVIIAFSFVSELGSIATFAGLITAGVALALQNVIQSLVGYFFLIGKYGIRGGDRVQIGGVNGEVIDVGLVRIHLMELGGTAADTPTGRVVAFSNSIVFQPTAGLFKQIPGTSFAWHEITLTLPPDTNLSSVRERLMKSVHAGLAEYKDEIARQHSAIEETLESAPGVGLEPTIRLRYTTAGVEALVRYPVALRHASEIDERVTIALFSDFNLGRSGGTAWPIKTTSAAD
jgi:small-conductance mechanosensitive channel